MKFNANVIVLFLLFIVFSMNIRGTPVKYNPLSQEEKEVILDKGTERPFSGEFANHHEEGLYICKQCNAILYHSTDKFESDCGWPSFDDELKGAVMRVPDADGQRTEIICSRCKGHLGHVFLGEGLTRKNVRHCVNSISMKFIPYKDIGSIIEKAYFAGGCFWGMEYHFMTAKGVVYTSVGYMGGTLKYPTYEEVCSGETGHKETLEVIYDPGQTSYEEMARLFFEIHDPVQADGQGPDRGEQYLSFLFYADEKQKETAERLVGILKDKGYRVATRIQKASPFWKAEAYHQKYYEKKHGMPYCHRLVKRFDGGKHQDP
ncbi:MAG: bifunctional methionine sulfoxide reductase B/A protein [Candidatus Aureabacteria bacterium]|nr:bifunctional methionine sulfoxide reductase B/A protein [Candidatus Auribacterota bacterium]